MKNTTKLTLAVVALFAATSLHADTPIAVAAETNAVPAVVAKSATSKPDSATAAKKTAKPKRKPGFRLPSKQFRPNRNR